MTIKPFAIQGADLTLGGVNLQAGTTGVVIPGVTQAANYKVEEVNETDVDQTYEFGAETEVVVIDAALYAAIIADGNVSVFADFTATTDDEGAIDEIKVNGQGTYTQQLATTAGGNDMYAYKGAGNASDRPLVPQDWVQIPFRPKMRAGEVENVSGGGNTEDVTFANNVVEGSGWELGLSPGPDFTTGEYSAGEGDPDLGPQYFRVAGGDQYEHLHFRTSDDSKFDLYVGNDQKYFKLSKDGPAEIGTQIGDSGDSHTWTFGTDGSLTFPDGSKQNGSLEPELTKVEGTIVANANIQFGDNSNGTIAVVDSQGDYDQWFNYTVGDTDGVLYACGENDDGPQYVWAFNTDGSVKWKVGIDDIDNNNVTPRTLSVRGDFLVVSATYNDVVTDEREIVVITLNKADGTVDESYTLSTNNIGTKRVRDFAVDDSGNHIIVGSLDGETIAETNLTPIKTAWGSNVNILTVANSSLSSPIRPWNYNFEVQNDSQDANSWYFPDGINQFNDLPVTTVSGTGGPQYYEGGLDYADGQLQLVISNTGATWKIRLDATWVNGAAQTHLLAQTGSYSFTITPGDYQVTQVSPTWTDVGGGIFEVEVTPVASLADGSGNINSILINKSQMLVYLRYVPAGLDNSGYTGGMIDSYGVSNSGQGYATGDVVKVRGSQMGGIDTISLSGISWPNSTGEFLYFSDEDYPGFSAVQTGWRAQGPGIDGWATISGVQHTGGLWRFDLPQGTTVQPGEQYFIDNNGNDIVFPLYDYGGNYFVISSDPVGKVADAVSATTRIVMSQGVDYRGVENTTLYSTGAEYTAGQVYFGGTNGINAPWGLSIDTTLTEINALMNVGTTLTLTLGGTNISTTVLEELGIGDGVYRYLVGDLSGFGTSGTNLDSIRVGLGTYTGTWNLRRGLNSQAFIRTGTWEHTFGGSEYEQFSSVVHDSYDNSIYALGEFYNGTNEIVLFKFNYEGDVTWIKYVEDETGDGSNAGSVAVDGTGNVYTCATNNGGNTLVTKLTGSGVLVWQVIQNNSDNWNNNPSMVLDTNGDIILGGAYYTQNDPDENHNLWSFMKLSKADGSIIWSRYLDNQEKYDMYDMYDYDIDSMTVQGDDIFYSGYAVDENNDYVVALAFKFNTTGLGLGTFGRWIYSLDPNASWSDNTSNAVVATATILAVDQTTFTQTSGSLTVTADAVGNVTPSGYPLGVPGNLEFNDGSELTTAGIARHSVEVGGGSLTLTAAMNGKFIYYYSPSSGQSSNIIIPAEATTPLPIGFTLTVVVGEYNGQTVYVNNAFNEIGDLGVKILVSGTTEFATNYWMFDSGAAGIYTIMKIDTDTWMLAGPGISID